MNRRVVRAAVTQTTNRFAGLPASVDELGELRGRMHEVRDANLDHHRKLAEHAATLGVQAICFGEVFTGPYFAITQDDVWFELAEPLDGPTLAYISALARRLEMVIVAPIYELDSESGERFNTALVVDKDGEFLGFYSKTHIPNGSNELGVFAEGFYFSRSTGRPQQGPKVTATNPYFPVFETAAGKIGVAICYDRHFEGVISSLSAGGAELIFSPAVTFGAKSARMWPLEFAVDAARWKVFIGGSNRLGHEPPWHQDFFGNSHFVGPNGRVTNISDHSELVVSELDLDELRLSDPSGWNLDRDRRPDIYARRQRDRGGARPFDVEER